jgi:hypothetical protein
MGGITMKKLAVFEQKVLITIEIDVDENITGEEIEEIAYSQFGGLTSYVGNGGMDKLVGVSDGSIEICDDLEYLGIEEECKLCGEIQICVQGVRKDCENIPDTI